jgi:hypothetical protein
LEQQLDVPGTSLSLRPPAAGLRATVSGEDAVTAAEQQFSSAARPKRVTAELAWEDANSRLVWVVSVVGVCVPDLGPGDDQDPCATNEWLVVVDAISNSVDGMVSFRKVEL